MNYVDQHVFFVCIYIYIYIYTHIKKTSDDLLPFLHQDCKLAVPDGFHPEAQPSLCGPGGMQLTQTWNFQGIRT